MRQFAVCVGLAVIALEPSIAELWNVTINGTTYKNVQETLPHIGVINGIVLAPDGTPAGYATVGISEEPKRISDHVFEVPTGRRLLRTKLQTNADGSFTVSNLPLSTYTVAAYVDRGRYIGSISLSADAPEHSANIRLEPAYYIHGRVVDTGGNPVSGAQVDASPEIPFERGSLHAWEYPLHGMTSTGEDGTFEIQAAPIATYTFLVARENLVGQYKRNIAIGDAPLEFVAKSPGEVHGKVVDVATGYPLSGIPVSLFGIPDVNGMTTVTSDDDGVFRIENAYPGKWNVSIVDDPQDPGDWVLSGGVPTVAVPEGGTCEVLLKLVRRDSVSE